MTSEGQTSEAIWAVSDGRAGLANQVLGLAEAVARLSARPIEVKTIDFRPYVRWKPASWLARTVPVVLHGTELKPGSNHIFRPWPRVFVGCGKSAIAISLYLKRQGANSFRVQTQDPRMAAKSFDLVVPPMHDQLTGANVFPIIGSPNRVTAEKLAEASQKFAPIYAKLPHPRVAVLIGGDAKRLKLTDEAMQNIIQALLKLTKDGAGLMITTSRRTGEANTQKLRTALAGTSANIWDGTGDNPYFGILALADFILVTEDSVNMATEAAATGKPIFTLKLSGNNPKYARFHDELAHRGIAKPFNGTLESFAYEPLCETDRVAREICRRAHLPV